MTTDDDHMNSPNLPDDDDNGTGYVVNGEIMIIAIAVLFTVVLFIFCLHIYAKWFWRQSGRIVSRRRRRRGSWSSIRRRFAFTEEEDVGNSGNRNAGLDKAVIEALPIFIYQSECYQDGLDCSVCLCEFEENEKGRLLPRCNHSFHVECIEMWLHSHSTCPLCRTYVQPEPRSGNPSDGIIEEASSGGDDSTVVEMPNLDSNCEEMEHTRSQQLQLEEGEPSSESAKSSITRLSSLKRLLRGENKIFPSNPDVVPFSIGIQNAIHQIHSVQFGKMNLNPVFDPLETYDKQMLDAYREIGVGSIESNLDIGFEKWRKNFILVLLRHEGQKKEGEWRQHKCKADLKTKDNSKIQALKMTDAQVYVTAFTHCKRAYVVLCPNVPGRP
eukprot:Gb_02533 [translate_table: standard]